MIQGIARRLRQRAADLRKYVVWRCGKRFHESVYFYTFHRCASTLFGGYVLRNIAGLRHVDYADRIYGGASIDRPSFIRNGFIYGPIRLSADRLSPVYAKLVGPCSDSEFVRDKIAIFLVRDPRDLLVSTYYSFGYTHGLSPVAEIRQRQEQERREIQRMTVDEYALCSAPGMRDHFETADRLSNASKRSVILKYEDMISNWNAFAKGLTTCLEIGPAVLTEIYEKSRPREKPEAGAHRRCGKPEGFRDALQMSTVIALNGTLGTILERFQYSAR
jgi:hypothetical protein